MGDDSLPILPWFPGIETAIGEIGRRGLQLKFFGNNPLSIQPVATTTPSVVHRLPVAEVDLDFL
jgi:hypothetical protein